MLRFAKLLRSLVVVLSLTLAGSMAAQESNPYGRFADRFDALHDELIEIRHDFHRHPEVSGSEERTSGVVAARLNELGFQVRTGVGGYGVVGRLDGGRPGPIVAFRADMDAVPSNPADPVEFRSETKGVRHICGHDIHTTVGLALAEGFAAIRDDLAGSSCRCSLKAWMLTMMRGWVATSTPMM